VTDKTLALEVAPGEARNFTNVLDILRGGELEGSLED
jgi:hypothetical protein